MDIIGTLESLAQSSHWAVYGLVFAAPFVQEDSAVVVTATLTALGKLALGPAVIAIFLGLFFSDIWKYWIGWAALKNRKGAAFAKKEKVLALNDKIQRYPFTTLVTARFIPLTRIPSYIACGFFRMSYAKFCLFVAITGALYIGLFFGVFHMLGAVIGEKLKWILPVIGVAFILSILGYNYLNLKLNRKESA